jgi:formiminotetrahydrofolate cyclodeaminase
MQVAEVACRVMQSLIELRPISNPNVAADLNVGVWMALAAAESALENVAANLKSLEASDFVTARSQRHEELKRFLRQQFASNL